MAERVNIMWGEEQERLIEKIIARHAGRMGEAGIATRSKVRPGGEIGLNRSGAIMFALMLAAGETEEKPEIEKAG